MQLGVLVWSQAWLGVGQDSRGGSIGGGGAVRTGRGGAKRGRRVAMVRAEAEALAVADAMWWAKAKALAKAKKEGAQEGVALALWSWS